MGDDGRPTDRLFVSSLLGRSVRYSSSHNSVRQISAGVGKGGTAGRRNGKEGKSKWKEVATHSASTTIDPFSMSAKFFISCSPLRKGRRSSTTCSTWAAFFRSSRISPLTLSLSAALHCGFFPQGHTRGDEEDADVALCLRFRDEPHQLRHTNASRVRRIRFHFLDRGNGMWMWVGVFYLTSTKSSLFLSLGSKRGIPELNDW